jgi:chaperonin GroEL
MSLMRAKAAIGKLSDENADVQPGINIVLRRLRRRSARSPKMRASKARLWSARSPRTSPRPHSPTTFAGSMMPALRVALQDAASGDVFIHRTEAMVAEAPKKKEAPAAPGGGMGGMDY